MLGRVLETFDDETLGRFLTSKMAPGQFFDADDDSRCFWGVVGDGLRDNYGYDGLLAIARARRVYAPTAHHYKRSIGVPIANGYLLSFDAPWFDALCMRFGTARVAQAIRTRALTILLRRGGSVESLVSSQHSTRAAHEGASV